MKNINIIIILIKFHDIQKHFKKSITFKLTIRQVLLLVALQDKM